MADPGLYRPAAILTTINPVEAPSATEWVDRDFDLALTYGALDAATQLNPPVVPPFAGYSDFSAAIKMAVRQSYASLMAALAPEAWIDPTLLGTWVAEPGLQVPQYRREAFDLVRLRGAVQSGTVGTSIFTLPAGYRPPADIRFSIVNGSTTSPGYITVTSTGSVIFDTSSNSIVALDGICFSTTP